MNFPFKESVFLRQKSENHAYSAHFDWLLDFDGSQSHAVFQIFQIVR